MQIWLYLIVALLTLLLANLQHILTQRINGMIMVIGQIGIYLCYWFVLHALMCLHLTFFLTYIPMSKAYLNEKTRPTDEPIRSFRRKHVFTF